ncbi:MAG TPA: hypothetical protein DHW82_09345 [Spirochaetia bacterium]|nr:hypothetical protein [Spirochaetia bacterium]
MNILFSASKKYEKELSSKSRIYVEYYNDLTKLEDSFMKYKGEKSCFIFIDEGMGIDFLPVFKKMNDFFKTQNKQGKLILFTENQELEKSAQSFVNLVVKETITAEKILFSFRSFEAFDMKGQNICESLGLDEILENSKTSVAHICLEPIDIAFYLEMLQEGKNQGIYEKLKPYLVYPGKTLISGLENKTEYEYEDDSIEYHLELKILASKRLGFVLVKDKKITFMNLINIKENKKEAFAYFFSVPELTKEELLNFFEMEIRRLGIKSGICYDDIFHFSEDFQEKPGIVYFKAAEGKDPQNGHNEYALFLKEWKKNHGKIVNRFGMIDYRERENLLTVKKGEAIAKLIPEVKNEDGYDVTGTVLLSSYLSKVPLKIGKNLTLNPETNEYLSDIDGMVVMSQNHLYVDETLVVHGNVDMAYGNIHYDKNIIVEGDIVSGMQVECGGNLVVKGVIEDAFIEVSGDLIVKGMINCKKKAVFVKGKTCLEFIENSSLDCLNHIYIYRFALHAVLRSTQKIISIDKSKVIGGELTSAQGIDLFSLGNPEYIPAKIVLGINFYIEEQIKKLLNAMKSLKIKISEEMENISTYVDVKKDIRAQLKNMSKEKADYMIHEFSLIKELRDKENKVGALYEELTKTMQKEISSYLAVRDNIYQNNTISVIGIQKKLSENYENMIFYLDINQAEIVAKKASDFNTDVKN